VISTAALLCGGVAGAGLGLGVRRLKPRRPDLGELLRPGSTTRRAPLAAPAPGEAKAADQWAERIGARLLDSPLADLAQLRPKDLALLGITPAQQLGRQVAYALAGFAIPAFFSALLALIGAAPPLAPPAAAGVLFAVGLWLRSGADTRQQAQAARVTYRYAVSSFLERTALARLSDAGAAEALYRTAEVGDGPALERIRATLEHARLAGISPWKALRTLAEELDIPELARPAEALALAGEESAPVYNTLQGQATQLRSARLSDMKAKANEASQKLVVPVVVLGILVIVYVAFPAFDRILSV
jgi:tight adherence protein C